MFPPFSDRPELTPFADLESEIEVLSSDLNFCKRKDTTEEEWCDRLAYPMLRLAALKARTPGKVDIATAYVFKISLDDVYSTNVYTAKASMCLRRL